MVLRWQLQLGTLPIPKSATPSRQRENLDLDGFELTDDEVAAISGLAPAGRAAVRRRPRHPRGVLTATPTTPYLRVDLDRLRRNVRRAAEWASGNRVSLRPHAKTHKSPEIARLQLGSGAVGLTVATLGEAEIFARHGCADLFVAYPVWVDGLAAERLRDLAERGSIAIGVDSVEGAARAGRLLAPYGVEVVVEVDSGQHRTGCPPEEAGAVAVAAARAGLRVRGVFTFPGHSYAPDGMAAAAADEARALATARDAMVAEGLEVSVVSGGSTPSWAHLDTDGRHRGAAGRLRLRRRPAVGARHACRRSPWP